MFDISFQRNLTMTPQLAQLIAKLEEIFQINQPDLDFGIYRILNSRQTQITNFYKKRYQTKLMPHLMAILNKQTTFTTISTPSFLAITTKAILSANAVIKAILTPFPMPAKK